MTRAITQEAKNQKKEKILQVATKLFENSSFENLTMQQIAKESGVSKGTMFNYFASKEVLFFEIFLNQSKKLEDELFCFLKLEGKIGFEQFKKEFLKSTEEYIKNNPLALKLLAIKNVILEKNIPQGYAKNIKCEMHDEIEILMKKVSEKVEGLNFDLAFTIYNVQSSLITGFASANALPKATHNIIEENNLYAFKTDVSKNTIQALECYLNGLQKMI